MGAAGPWASWVQRAACEAATALPGPAGLCLLPHFIPGHISYDNFMGPLRQPLARVSVWQGACGPGWAWAASGQEGWKEGVGRAPAHSGPPRMLVSALSIFCPYLCSCRHSSPLKLPSDTY